MGRADLQGEEDLTTDPTEYNNLGSDYKSIDFIDISVQIEDYGQAGSIALANTAPDLRIDISDGVGSWVSFDLDLSTVYTSPGQIITFRIDVNNDPLGIIRTHWLDADNQDIIVVGKNVDYYQSTQVYDIIDYTNFDVTIDGVKWTKIGDHDDTLSFDWDTTTITPQTDVDLRANSSDNLDEFSDYNTIPFDFAMEIVDTQSELTWNTGLLDLGGVFDGGHVEGSATVNALGIHTNVQVTRTSGEDWITPTDSDLGDMTDNQQPVMFNCNPPIPTPETTYSADFKVASVQDPLGEDITVSCDVQEAEDCGNQICEAGEDCGSCAVDCACANSGSCEVDFCFCPLDWGGKLCDIDLSPQVTIISVDSDNLVDFAKPGETNPVEIIFDVTDVDGVGDLDESSLAIDYDFSGEGEQSRTGDINDCTFQDNGNTRTYTCQIDMQFYDSPGSWTATVLIKDSILNQGQDTHFFTVNLLRAISLNQATISFPQVTPGDTDIFAQADTIITNKGNFDIPGDSKLQIISWDLIGQITSSEFIPGDNFMSIDESDSANVCSNGQQLSVGEGVEILNVLLPRGSQASPTSTRNIYHCLKTVPVGLSVQTYSTTTPWQIEVVLALAVLIPAIKKKKKKKRKKSKKLLESFNENAEELLEFYKEHETKLRDVEKLLKFYKKHKKQLEETPEFEEESESEEIKIPLEIFRQELSPAEVVCKYLKENKKLKFSEIAKLINRDQRTVWINYRNAIEKKKAKIKVKENLVVVSVGIFVNRKLSILESIVKHLREKGISNSRIAEMLNKSASNIWTLNSRATKKITNG
jgi:DNA-directed RNA polymerase specialized sigma24 family protein